MFNHDILSLICDLCDRTTLCQIALASRSCLDVAAEALYREVVIDDDRKLRGLFFECVRSLPPYDFGVSCLTLSDCQPVGPSDAVSKSLSLSLIKTVILDCGSGRWKHKGLRNLPAYNRPPLTVDRLRILQYSHDTSMRGNSLLTLLPLLDPARLSLENSNLYLPFFAAAVKGPTWSNLLDASCSQWRSLVKIDVSPVWLETSYELEGRVERSPFQRLPLVPGRTVLLSFCLLPATFIPLHDLSNFDFFSRPSVLSVLSRTDVSFEVLARSEGERTAFLAKWKELELGRFFGDELVRVTG